MLHDSVACSIPVTLTDSIWRSLACRRARRREWTHDREWRSNSLGRHSRWLAFVRAHYERPNRASLSGTHRNMLAGKSFCSLTKLLPPLPPCLRRRHHHRHHRHRRRRVEEITVPPDFQVPTMHWACRVPRSPVESLTFSTFKARVCALILHAQVVLWRSMQPFAHLLMDAAHRWHS